MTATILILGGTGEARALAAALNPEFRVITSLAGATRTPRRIAGAVRTGGFGGAGGLAAYLRDNAVDCLVDATHPYAARMGHNAAAAAEMAGVPLLRLERPPWTSQPGDDWTEFPDLQSLATALPDMGKTVLITLGGADLHAFSGITGLQMIIRAIDPPDPMPVVGEFDLILSGGPFDFESEVALLNERKIDLVVSRNAGGDATYAKIAAARHLSVPVAMLARPDRPAAPSVATVDEAVRRIGAALAS